MDFRRVARHRLTRLSLLCASAMCQAAMPAHAQSAPQAAPQDTGGDIVVTALKRDTNLQDTPISISAVAGDTLVKSGVRDIAGLNAPSLNFVDGGPSNRRVVIRGIQAAGEPTVGVYYDETPVTGVVGSSSDAGGTTPELRLFDVSRIEVLRGPQGTLYGAGSMGGTLRVIYNKPTFKTEGAADATVSSTDGGGLNYTFNGMVNLPIVNDLAALRVSGFYSHDAGYIDNVALGINNINQTKIYGGRAQLRITPAHNVTIDLAAFLNRTRTDTNSWTLEAGRFVSDALTRQPITDDFNLYSGTVNWDLGAVKLTGIVSYQDRYLASGSDVTKYIQTLRTAASCARIYNSGATCGSSTLSNYYAFVDNQIPSALDPQQNMKTISSELRLSSNRSGPLNWTVGGFFSRRKIDVANPQVHAAADGTLEPDATLITVRYINDRLKQIAAFGEVSWDITRRLNVTGGMRYFRYDRTITGQTPIGNVLVGSSVLPLTTVASSEDGEIFKGNASYKITRNIMVYAEAAQGFRPGGVNQTIGLDPSLAPYKSDSLWNYEVGVKSTLFDRLLTLNADVYQIDWSNMQITGRTTNGAFSFITNAGAARVRGIEAEATLRPMRGLILQGNGTYTDAVLTTNQSTTAVTAAGLKGDRIPYVPKFTGGVSAEYNWAMSSRIAGMARIDLRHASGSYSDFRPTGTYTRFMKGYELVNLRVGGTLDDGRLGVYLFVNNLFDTTAILRATSSAILVGRTAVTSAQPRTIGLNLQTKF